jgi:hypothetical protein
MRKGSTTYSNKEDIIDFVLSSIGVKGLSLRSACREAKEHFELESFAFKTADLWFQDEKYSTQYAHAREARADKIFEEILLISDSDEDDILYDAQGSPIPNSIKIQRNRLQVDARKWMLGKMQPKKYSDKIENVNTNINLDATELTPDEVRKKLNELDNDY